MNSQMRAVTKKVDDVAVLANRLTVSSTAIVIHAYFGAILRVFQLRTRIGPPLVTWNGVWKFLATQHLKQLEASPTKTLAQCDPMGNLGSSAKYFRESKKFLIVCHVLMRVCRLKSHVGLSVKFLQDSGNSIGPRTPSDDCNHSASVTLLQIS